MMKYWNQWTKDTYPRFYVLLKCSNTFSLVLNSATAFPLSSILYIIFVLFA